MTSMITNYVNILKDRYKNNTSDRNQERHRTHARRLRPKGKLLEPATFSFDKDADSIRYFAKGIQGKGNDYSIGRINDVTIKLGGLGIAAVIATSKGSPLRKGMEFVGLGSWLAAMSLWPKLAINKPIKHFKGVDLDLEYQTSSGHKKKFYQDPQFMCWDLMSDEQIYKMGDKLGVPRNIKNRRKAIENKARQVAIQGNTLSLLTAGLATPLIASLAADTIDKRFLSHTVPIINDTRADIMSKNMTNNINSYTVDQKTIDAINNIVTDNASTKTREELKTLFKKKTGETSLRRVINSTIDKLFRTSKHKTNDIALSQTLNTAISKQIGENVLDENGLTKLQELGKKYGDVITPKNIGKYLDELEEFLIENSKLDIEEVKETAIPKVKALFSKQKTISVVSPKEIKAQLIHMSQMIDIYNQKVLKDFEKGFFLLTGNGEGSVNAKLWKKMNKDITKALHISNKNLADIVSVLNSTNEAGKTIHKVEILGHIFEDVISDNGRMTKTIRELGKASAKIAAENEKHVRFSLEYLDQIQHILSQTNQAGPLDDFSQSLKIMISQQRQKVLKNYIGTNETIFAPINIINTLRQAKQFAEQYAAERNTNPNFKAVDSNKVYEAVRNLMIDGQTTDHFLNKLSVYDKVIKDERDFKDFIKILFTDLSDDIKALLPKELVEKINTNTHMQKHLFTNLTDGVKLEYVTPDNADIIKTLNSMKLYKYADDLFDIRFNNPESIIQAIGEKAKSNSAKLNELKHIFKISQDELNKIKAGDFQPLRAICQGAWDKGSGYFENGRHKLKTILTYLGIKDLSTMGDISILKTNVSRSLKVAGQDLFSLVQTNAKETLNYNRWFKRVGLAFVGVCAATALALSQIGKKNEFNPDIYQEREKA